ncbi:MAG: tetratricopeptide repeat protein [Hyphomicrobiales bacterium]
MSAAPPRGLRAALPFLVSGALLAGAGAVHAALERRSAAPPVDELLYYPSGTYVRQASLGYETAASDVAWLRGIQYYGEHRLTDQKFDLIGHVMSVVTDLDPRFEQPYVFGAFVLAQERKDVPAGLALLAKGREANPESWRLAFETGFLYYVCAHDFAAAGRYFAMASRLPGHPAYAERFAAWANERAGRRDVAILLWKRVLATGNEYMQETARRELRNLGVEDLP